MVKILKFVKDGSLPKDNSFVLVHMNTLSKDSYITISIYKNGIFDDYEDMKELNVTSNNVMKWMYLPFKVKDKMTIKDIYKELDFEYKYTISWQ